MCFFISLKGALNCTLVTNSSLFILIEKYDGQASIENAKERLVNWSQLLEVKST
jgi:hypothetical protein